MAINVKELPDDELENLIENHRRLGATDRLLYMETLKERGGRKGKRLEFEKSLSIISCAAREGRFLSYMQLAAASGIGWDQAHFPMNKHLWDLVEYSHRKHGVLFSAIVVNSDNLGSGKMDPPTLRGFIGAARDLGYPVTDERAF